MLSSRRIFSLLTLVLIFVSLVLVTFLFREPVGFFLREKMSLYAISEVLNYDNAGARFAIGNYYFSSSGYNILNAERNFKAVLSLNSAFPGAHYQLSRVYFIQGNLDSALIEINKEILLYPGNKRSYYIRGLVHGYNGKYDEGIDDFRTFLAWKPESWAGRNDLIWVYFQKGDYENAREIAENGTTLYPENPWLLNSLGVAYLNLKRYDEAKVAFEKALHYAYNVEPATWGEAYPGNNPRVYEIGAQAMRDSIEKNLSLIKKKELDI